MGCWTVYVAMNSRLYAVKCLNCLTWLTKVIQLFITMLINIFNRGKVNGYRKPVNHQALLYFLILLSSVESTDNTDIA